MEECSVGVVEGSCEYTEQEVEDNGQAVDFKLVGSDPQKLLTVNTYETFHLD